MPPSVPRRAVPLHTSVSSRNTSVFAQWADSQRPHLCPRQFLSRNAERTGYLTRLQCSLYATACRFARPLNWPPQLSQGSGTFTSELSRNRSPSYESDMTTWVNRQFPGRDFHPLETQPYGLRTHWVTTSNFKDIKKILLIYLIPTIRYSLGTMMRLLCAILFQGLQNTFRI